MIIPNYDGMAIVDENGMPTAAFTNILQTLLKNMTQCLSNEGFLIPAVSSANDSLDPPQAGGQKAVIQASFNSNATPVNPNSIAGKVGAQAGTLIFDPAIANGSIDPLVPNGQLYILLGDGTFHAIPNL
jgi:hypothetical protein